MKRYRVKVASKTYKDPGPDLLRPQGTAAQVFAENMGKTGTGWFMRRQPAGSDKWTNWRGPMTKREILEAVEGFTGAHPTARFQTGRSTRKKVEPKVEMLIVNVKELVLSGVKPGARLVASLTKEQFPNLDIGGFNCREYNNIPGSGWSDHAWGDAVDLDLDGGSPGPNDTLTDWCVRMAKAHCMGDVNQFIGSHKGRVVNFVAPSYGMNSGGPSSHLTHVHCSYRQHFGADPNCR